RPVELHLHATIDSLRNVKRPGEANGVDGCGSDGLETSLQKSNLKHSRYNRTVKDTVSGKEGMAFSIPNRAKCSFSLLLGRGAHVHLDVNGLEPRVYTYVRGSPSHALGPTWREVPHCLALKRR